jgi:sec-independent protein translocase protein TatA
VFTNILQPSHVIIVLVVALLILGPKRLPEAGRALGQGLKEFKNSVSSDHHDDPQTRSQHPPLQRRKRDEVRSDELAAEHRPLDQSGPEQSACLSLG